MDGRKLDCRIRLERATKVRDTASGEMLETWATLGPTKIFASRRRASARETLAAAEVSGSITDVFEIRYDSSWSDLDVTDRLIFESRVYDIQSVDEIGRREGLRIAALARAERIEEEPTPGDGPLLDFSIATNSQYIGQVV